MAFHLEGSRTIGTGAASVAFVDSGDAEADDADADEADASLSLSFLFSFDAAGEGAERDGEGAAATESTAAFSDLGVSGTTASLATAAGEASGEPAIAPIGSEPTTTTATSKKTKAAIALDFETSERADAGASRALREPQFLIVASRFETTIANVGPENRGAGSSLEARGGREGVGKKKYGKK